MRLGAMAAALGAGTRRRAEERARIDRATKCQAFEKMLRDKEKRRKAAMLRKGVTYGAPLPRNQQMRERANSAGNKESNFGFLSWFRRSTESEEPSSSSNQNRPEVEVQHDSNHNWAPETRVQVPPRYQELRPPVRWESDSSLATIGSDRPPPYDRAVTPPPPYWSLDFD